MPVYQYKARNRAGELITGTLEDDDERSVAASFDRLGYSVIEVIPRAKLFSLFTDISGRFERLRKQDVIIFTRQLATLIHAGIPLSPSLTTICEQTVNKKLKAVLQNVRETVQQGRSFSEALAQHPHVFSELFISMIRVGETGGILDNVLGRLAALGTQELEITSRIRSALIYPVVLVVITFLIVNFLVIGVLPKFVMVFRASQAELPLPTQVVLWLSVTLRQWWFAILMGAGLLVLWFRSYINKPEGRFRFDAWLLTLPIFGKLYAKIQIARFARTLSVLISSGIPLLQGLVVVEKIVTNMVFQRTIQNIRMAITEGRPLVEPFKISGFFSPMVIQMISVGEKSGTLDQTLNEIAGFYEPEIEYTIKNLTALLEPLMLLIMGVMVGFIALSVLLPIFNLIRVFRG